MPSACMKPEKKASVEAEDPMKQAISVVEKKVRNLEKRKGKLDEYKQKVKGGASLNDDQKQAVGRYDSVLTNLEFARELQKQFSEIQEKAEKLLKKKLRAEQKVLHLGEVNRMQEVLRLQSLLDNMGSEDAREHFKSGKHGAVILSEEKLSQLDELYKLISPTRDGETSYAEQLLAASEHIVNFLDGKDKEVAGTTYRDLKQLVNEINKCGYFDRTPEAEEETAATEEAQKEEEESEEEEEEGAAIEEPHAPEPTPAVPTQPSAPQAPTQPMTFTEETLPAQVQPAQAMVEPEEEGGQYGTEGESFFSTMELPKPRAFTDIVSSVQGTFKFLQDSEIESPDASSGAASAAHVDPAVVAARPMGAVAPLSAPHQQHPQQAPGEALAQGFGAQAGAYSAATTALQEQMAQLSAQAQEQGGSDEQVSEALQDSLGGSQSFRERLVTPQTQASQYTQGAYEAAPEQSWATAADQSWGSSTAEHNSWVEQTSQSQSWAEQASSHQPAWSTGANAQSLSQLGSNPPAPIPMPNETVPGQSLSGFGADSAPSGYSQVAADSQEKKSQLNPNANIFNMYGGQEGGFPQHPDYDQRRSMGKDQGGYGNADRDDYQTQGYRSGPREYRGGQRGGAGGQRGPRGGMNNYTRGGRGGYAGGPRGGGGGATSYQNGSRGARAGNGNHSNAAAGSSGQARFQGYPPRPDYQGSSPFTTSSSSLASSHLRYQGNEGATQPRAGARGGMRGGPRGGSRGGRGGNQGYGGRPGSGQ